jgi:hypothetical protein
MSKEQLSKEVNALKSTKESFLMKLKRPHISRSQKNFLYEKIQNIDDSLNAMNRKLYTQR